MLRSERGSRDARDYGCTCHLMSRKGTSSYYYQAAAEMLCEACMNRPIVTFRTSFCVSSIPISPAVCSTNSRQNVRHTSQNNVTANLRSTISVERSSDTSRSTKTSVPSTKNNLATRAIPAAVNSQTDKAQKTVDRRLHLHREPGILASISSANSTSGDDMSWEDVGESTESDETADNEGNQEHGLQQEVESQKTPMPCARDADANYKRYLGDSSSSNSSSSSSSSSNDSSNGTKRLPRLTSHRPRHLQRRQQVRQQPPLPPAQPPNRRRPSRRRRLRRRPRRRVSASPSSSSGGGGGTGRRQRNSSGSVGGFVSGGGGGRGGRDTVGSSSLRLSVNSRATLDPATLADPTTESLLRGLMSSGILQDWSGLVSPAQQAAPRVSEIRKPEPRSLVEKAIMDFFSTHKAESALRVLPTQTDDKWAAADTSGLQFGREGHPVYQLAGCHLLKDSIVIGDYSVFEESTSRQFILPMFDSLLDAFLGDSSILRASCARTRCRIELSRRILNRRVLHGSWVKYMVITVTGPTMHAIENCDKMLRKSVPAYRLRRAHDRETTCCLYLKEETPDNADLCFSHQRTGVATTRYGSLKLQSPFVKPKGSCKQQGLTKYGRAALSGRQSSGCVKFVYSSALQRRTGNVPSNCTGVGAIAVRQAMADEAMEQRHAAVEERKKMLLTLHRV